MKNTSNKGIFITFEGTEGCGKSSISKKVFLYLKRKYPNKVVLTHEPGCFKNKIAEDIRTILLDKKNKNMHPYTEAFLFAASRTENVNNFIIPNLKKGKIVLCDRYIHSSLVYQGIARNLGVDNVMKINKFATNGIYPDLCILILVKPEIGFIRIKKNNRNTNRIDQESISLHKKVYTGYKLIAKKHPNSFAKIDGAKPIENVIENVIKIINNFLKKQKYV